MARQYPGAPQQCGARDAAADGDTLTAADFTLGAGALRLSDHVGLPGAGIDLEQLERSLLVQALDRSGWNQTRAAQLLGLGRAS